MAATGREREDRAARERARTYAARQELHRRQVGRRRRDDLIAGIGGGVIVLAIAAGQFAYYQVGPGAPAPSDTPAPTGTSQPSPAGTDAPLPAVTGTAPAE